MLKPIRVLLVEDEGLYREMLTISLQSVPEIQVVGAVADGKAAIAAARDLKPAVILLDIDLGEGDSGITVGLEIRRMNRDTGIVLLSNHKAKQYLQAIPTPEAHGWSYVLKRSISDLQTLVRAVQGAALGLMVLDPLISQELAPRKGSRLSNLTPRQLEVLRLVAQGYSNAAIARELSLAHKSVENYLTGIYQELRVWEGDSPGHPRVKAVLLYLKETHSTEPRYPQDW